MSGQFEKALSEFNRAVDVSPKTADAVFSRGIAREKLLDWEGAIADYRSANDLYKVSFAGLKGPDDATCMNNIANAEAGMERWSDALKTYDYAIKLDSRPVAPKLGRALVQYQVFPLDRYR
jgi:tetratricopeptide (TPR) repeat protein